MRKFFGRKGVVFSIDLLIGLTVSVVLLLHVYSVSSAASRSGSVSESRERLFFLAMDCLDALDSSGALAEADPVFLNSSLAACFPHSLVRLSVDYYVGSSSNFSVGDELGFERVAASRPFFVYEDGVFAEGGVATIEVFFGG